MASGVIRSPLLTRLRELRIGPYDVGAQIESLGPSLVNWIGASALGLIGTATRLGIQLTIAFFGLYYLLLAPAGGLEAGPALHPLLAPQRRDPAGPIPRRHHLDPDRDRADRYSPGLAGRSRFLGDRNTRTRCSGVS